MLTNSKKQKMYLALKKYYKEYLEKKYTEIDESGTRLMVNDFLTDVLGFQSIEEIRTEYQIKGTYSDYMIQIKGVPKFLVEVKALSLVLSEKHLRQTINYGANEGIEFALLTNGKNFEFYRIMFEKPISAKKIFAIDLSDYENLKRSTEILQYLHKESVVSKGLEQLWNRCIALDPINVAGLFYSDNVVRFIRLVLTKKYKMKFIDDDIDATIDRIIVEPIKLEDLKTIRIRKEKKKTGEKCSDDAPEVKKENETTTPIVS